MRLLTSLLVAGLLLTVSVSSNYENTPSLQYLSLAASLQAPAINQVIVRGNEGLSRHRGSGRLESYQWLERSLA
ncbi:MAG: hypothetical protein OHK0047_06840 [Leptolyngbyaceae cyanobacterium]